MFGWELELALPHGGILVALALLFGLYMAWSIGANDVANAMGTSVGSGALTLKQAVLIAAVMELAGAVLVGSHVTETVRKGMFDPEEFEPMALVLGFLAALLSAAVWLQIATFFGWPVSTTHSIVGAVIGVGVLIGGMEAVKWGKVSGIVASWITSPPCGGILSFALFRLLQNVVINSKHPLRETYRVTPFLVFYVAFVLTLVMVWKGLPNLKLDLTLGRAVSFSAATGLLMAGLSVLWVRRLRRIHEAERIARNIEVPEDLPAGIPFTPKDAAEQRLRPALAGGSDLPAKRWEFRRTFEFEKMEGVFGRLMVVSACFLAFAHGANDVANAIGPLAAVLDIASKGVVDLQAQAPFWVLLLGGAGIVLGLATWGYRVIETVGRKITELTPSRGFAANVGAATTIVLASKFGFPISTTHTLVGAVLGIGLARGIGYLNLRVVRDIVISWIITVPAGALLAAVTFLILKQIFM